MSASAAEIVLTFMILTSLVLLGASRLSACIRILAAQGCAIGLLPVLLGGLHPRVLFLSVISVVLKGVVFPKLLMRTMRSANVRHEVEPLVGYTLSILLGVLMLGTSLWLADPLQKLALTSLRLLMPTGLFLLLVGFFLIVSRKTALNQVIGYLTLENGVYLFGLALAHEEPLLVETGILLDVFAAVFLMGIMIFHISREFDHIDVGQLTELKD